MVSFAAFLQAQYIAKLGTFGDMMLQRTVGLRKKLITWFVHYLEGKLQN